MTGTAPIRFSVAWFTTYECMLCPCVDVTTGLRLTEPLLRTIVVGDGAEFVVTTKVLGDGSVWLPLANDEVTAPAGCAWRDSGAEAGVGTTVWPCPAVWAGVFLDAPTVVEKVWRVSPL